MPNSLELPRMWSAVIKLVRRKRFARFRRSVVNELVALTHRRAFRRDGWQAGWRSGLEPRFAAIVGALNDLSKPAAGLRRINAVRIHGRAFKMVHLPTGEVWTTDV